MGNKPFRKRRYKDIQISLFERETKAGKKFVTFRLERTVPSGGTVYFRQCDMYKVMALLQWFEEEYPTKQKKEGMYDV